MRPSTILCGSALCTLRSGETYPNTLTVSEPLAHGRPVAARVDAPAAAVLHATTGAPKEEALDGRGSTSRAVRAGRRSSPSENPLGERRSVPHNSRTVCSCRGRAMRVSPRNPTCEPLAQSVEHLPFKVRRGGDREQRALHSVAEVSVLPALSVTGDGVLVTPGNRPC